MTSMKSKYWFAWFAWFAWFLALTVLISTPFGVRKPLDC